MFLAARRGEVAEFAQDEPSEDGPAGGRIYVLLVCWRGRVETDLLRRLVDDFQAASDESIRLTVMADKT